MSYLQNVITAGTKRSFCSVIGDDFYKTITQPTKVDKFIMVFRPIEQQKRQIRWRILRYLSFGFTASDEMNKCICMVSDLQLKG